MKSLCIAAAFFLCVAVSSRVTAQSNDVDTVLSNLADKLSLQIKDQGKKYVAVIDFTDLNGGLNGLGRYVSEQLTVDLVMDRKDFSVLDRANLKKILDEHKLTATGLVDPDNAKKLGQFAGVDALILGTLTPKGPVFTVTAKVITTDTAEIIGASRAEFKTDSNIEKLFGHKVSDAVSKPASTTVPAPEPASDSYPKFSAKARQVIASDIAKRDEAEFGQMISVRCLSVDQGERKFSGYGVTAHLIVVSVHFRLVTTANSASDQKWSKDYTVSESIDAGQFQGLSSTDTIERVVRSLKEQIQTDHESLSALHQAFNDESTN